MGTLTSIRQGGGLVAALVVLIAVDADGVKKKRKKRWFTCCTLESIRGEMVVDVRAGDVLHQR